MDTQDFWKIMFDELDKTSQKDWKKFVNKHDKKYKKKKLKKMKRKELIAEIYRLNKVTRKLNYYMNRYYPDQKLRKLEHFQVKKVYNWMLSDLK